MKSTITSLAACLLLVAVNPAQALSIIWDYTYDTNGFFTSERQAVMNEVANAFSTVSIDRGAITPGGVNSWNWYLQDPSGNNTLEIVNPSIGTGELRVYLGARSLGSGILGLGGNVGWTAGGTFEWIDQLSSTNTSTSYKPFGGNITMGLDIDWYSGLNPSVPSGQFDLYTVALHEMGHVLGIGLYGVIDVWDALVNTGNNTFVGTNASAIYGSAVPLENNWQHVLSGTTYNGDTLVMVPTLTSGTRREWTAVEFGILQDMGYAVVPEPSLWFILPLFLVGVVLYRRYGINKSRRYS